MPLYDLGTFAAPYLVYNAPVNEKTQKLRDMFKVDDKTGYPEHYSWRPMARLGPYFKPEDPFLKFNDYNPESSYSTKIGYGLVSVVLMGCGHAFNNYNMRLPIYARLWMPLVTSAAMTKLLIWIHEKTIERQAMKNRALIDYARKHPERFGEFHRPKLRECLFPYVPIR